jgi:hypothetical protein
MKEAWKALKPSPNGEGFKRIGDPDGTRTRGLRRDRAAR